MSVKKICVLGLGDAGVPLSAVIALKCPEVRVTMVKTNSEVNLQWNPASIPPKIYVPGLDDFIRKCQNKNLFFTTNEVLAIKEADIIIIASDSTSKGQGEGREQVVDLSKIEQAAYLIQEYTDSNKIVVENSSIPLKAAECVKNIFKYNNKPTVRIEVLSVPEFYIPGSTLKNLLNPSVVLIGCEQTPQGLAAAKKLSSFYERWVSTQNIITMSHWSVELAKLSSSAVIAGTLATIYALTCICEETNADLGNIMLILSDCFGTEFTSFIANLNPGKLFKELDNFLYMCKWLGLVEVVDYWQEVLRMYNLRHERFSQKLFSILNQTSTRKITILGFAFYKNTQMTDGSEAIELCKNFLKENTHVSVYDPKVSQKQVFDDLLSAGCGTSVENLSKFVSVHEDPYKASRHSHVVVVWNSWPDFDHFDYQRMFAGMTKPAYLFDYGGKLPSAKLSDIGYRVHVIGEPWKQFL